MNDSYVVVIIDDDTHVVSHWAEWEIDNPERKAGDVVAAHIEACGHTNLTIVIKTMKA